MNRVYSTVLKYNILILAFVLMDTHVHFVLYGGFGECNAFLHEYIRRTSSYISEKHSAKKKFRDVEIGHQRIDDEKYLLSAICYTIKNPPSARTGTIAVLDCLFRVCHRYHGTAGFPDRSRKLDNSYL